MSPLRWVGVCAGVVIAVGLAGCRTSGKSAFTASKPSPVAPVERLHASDGLTADTAGSHLQPVAYEAELAESPASVTVVTDTDGLFADASELPLDLLILRVIERNPSLQAAFAAWNAAAERYPQAIALEDPMLQAMLAPATLSSNSSTQASYVLGVAQRVPWYGKRALRGQMAEWEASAASADASEVQLRLELAARIAFFDYYLVHQELQLNQKNLEVTQDFRSSAKRKYEANLVSEQDLSLADLELAKIEQESIELTRAQKVAIARINTLLHRKPDAALPPPPHLLKVDGSNLDAISLSDLAIQHRPEIAALNARIQSEQSAAALACKEYYPDFEFMGRYDSFWTDKVQRPMVGMNMNVPLNRDRRGAAVREAQFRVTKLIAELNQQQDMVREDVQTAFARVEASEKTASLYDKRLLPAAETNLNAARAAYVAGSIDFLSLMSARREFIIQQVGYQRVLVEYHKSFADLQRAVGTAVITTPELSSPIEN